MNANRSAADLSRRAFLAGSAAAMPAYAAPGGATRPNVFIFLADDLGWNDVGYHGSEVSTPNIDRLAGRGVRFEHFYAFPLCSPTRSALMTGRSPMRFGLAYSVVRPWSPYGVPVDEHFMPETFKSLGYQTAAIGKWHLGHANRLHLPNQRGFDYFYGHMNGAIDYFTHERDGGIDWQRNGQSVREEGYSTDLLAADAIRWIRNRDRARPMFLYLPFNAPHVPLQAPPDTLKKYSSIRDPKRRTYAAMVDRLDMAIGQVLQTIEAEGLSRNSLIVFLSDNGGAMGAGGRNQPLRAGKATTFEGGMRVPAAMCWPGVLPAAGVSRQVMTVQDVFPTVIAAAGGEPASKKPLDGRNLWQAILDGHEVEREDLFFATDPGETIYHALRRRNWKLVQQIDKASLRTVNSLFNLAEDEKETTDLSAREPALAKELLAAIDHWRALHPQCDVLTLERPHPGWIWPKDWAKVAAD